MLNVKIWYNMSEVYYGKFIFRVLQSTNKKIT
jgi:hypothetical protein